MGGAPPPRLAAGNLSHFLPQFNPICTFCPTFSLRSPTERPNPGKCPPHGTFAGHSRPIGRAAAAQALLQSRECKRPCSDARLVTRQRPPRHPRHGSPCVACRAFASHATKRVPMRIVPSKHSRPPRIAAADERSPARARALGAARARVRSRGSPPGRTVLALARRALAGCGSTASTGTAADPAAVVPATAPLYVGADVRPEGSLKSAAISAGHGALTASRPLSASACGAADARAAPGCSYSATSLHGSAADAGLFLSSVSSATDADVDKAAARADRRASPAARAAASFPFSTPGPAGSACARHERLRARRGRSSNGQAARAGAHASRLSRRQLRAERRGVAFALVERFAVIGSEAGRPRRDRHDTRRRLAGASPRATRRCWSSPADALGHVYTGPSRLRGRARRPDGTVGALAGGGRGQPLARPELVVTRRSTSTRHPRTAPRCSGWAASSRARQRRRRSANCRANPGWRSALATSARTLAADVKALEGLSLARQLARRLGAGSAGSQRRSRSAD